MLEQAINDYLLWMISKKYAESTWKHYERILKYFLRFVNRQSIASNNVFTLDTLNAFQEHSGLSGVTAAVRGLSRYLFQQGKISRPIKRQRQRLPETYEDYLEYCKKVRQIHRTDIHRIAAVLSALNEYLKSLGIALAGLTIEHIDGFLAEYNAHYSPNTTATH